jgi:hypothetical protein
MSPMAVEREATHRAISLGEIIDVPVLLVHVSAREAMDQIKWARDRGLKVYGETCPQYLFLSESLIAQPGWEGAKYLCSPPPRGFHARILAGHCWRHFPDRVFGSLLLPFRGVERQTGTWRAPAFPACCTGRAWH